MARETRPELVIKRFKEFHKKCPWLKWNDVRILMDYMFSLTPKGFEIYVRDYFDIKYSFDDIKVVGGKQDQGIDIIGHKGKCITLIQCKKYISSHVKDKDILKFISDTKKYEEKYGKKLYRHFVSTNWFSPQAKKLLKDHGIIREDYKKILEMNKIIPIKSFIAASKEGLIEDTNYRKILDTYYYARVSWGSKILGKMAYFIIENIYNKTFKKKYVLNHEKAEDTYGKGK